MYVSLKDGRARESDGIIWILYPTQMAICHPDDLLIRLIYLIRFRIRSIHGNNTSNTDCCYLQFRAPRLPQGAVSGRVSAAARVRPACAGLSLGRLAPVTPTCLLVATSHMVRALRVISSIAGIWSLSMQK